MKRHRWHQDYGFHPPPELWEQFLWNSESLSAFDTDLLGDHRNQCDECDSIIDEWFRHGRLCLTAPSTQQPDRDCVALSDGDVIGDFEICEQIGKGAQGTVYLAKHRDFQYKVAIKLAHISDRECNTTRREIATIGSLAHPGIVTLKTQFRHAGRLCLVEEYCEGGTLEDKIREIRKSPITVSTLVQWISSVSDALEYATGTITAHQDLKPSNILFDKHNNPKVADFGLSLGSADVDFSGGTIAYEAPEIIMGRRATIASDIYSLGCILYACLTGAPPFSIEEHPKPFDAPVYRPAHWIMYDTRMRCRPHLRWPSVPADLAAIIRKCLAIHPAERYERPASLAADLRAFIDWQPTAARPPRLRRPIMWAAKHPYVTAMIVAGAFGANRYLAEATARAAAQHQRAQVMASRAQLMESIDAQNLMQLPESLRRSIRDECLAETPSNTLEHAKTLRRILELSSSLDSTGCSGIQWEQLAEASEAIKPFIRRDPVGTQTEVPRLMSLVDRWYIQQCRQMRDELNALNVRQSERIAGIGTICGTLDKDREFSAAEENLADVASLYQQHCAEKSSIRARLEAIAITLNVPEQDLHRHIRTLHNDLDRSTLCTTQGEYEGFVIATLARFAIADVLYRTRLLEEFEPKTWLPEWNNALCVRPWYELSETPKTHGMSFVEGKARLFSLWSRYLADSCIECSQSYLPVWGEPFNDHRNVIQSRPGVGFIFQYVQSKSPMENCEAFIDRAIELQPECCALYLRRGIQFLDIGQTGAALRDFEAAALAPDAMIRWECHRWTAVCHWVNRDNRGVESSLNKMKEMCESDRVWVSPWAKRQVAIMWAWHILSVEADEAAEVNANLVAAEEYLSTVAAIEDSVKQNPELLKCPRNPEDSGSVVLCEQWDAEWILPYLRSQLLLLRGNIQDAKDEFGIIDGDGDVARNLRPNGVLENVTGMICAYKFPEAPPAAEGVPNSWHLVTNYTSSRYVRQDYRDELSAFRERLAASASGGDWAQWRHTPRLCLFATMQPASPEGKWSGGYPVYR